MEEMDEAYTALHGIENGSRGKLDMAVKGAKTIAEYAIRKWLDAQNFAMECFTLSMAGNEGRLTDQEGNSVVICYDPAEKLVCVKED